MSSIDKVDTLENEFFLTTEELKRIQELHNGPELNGLHVIEYYFDETNLTRYKNWEYKDVECPVLTTEDGKQQIFIPLFSIKEDSTPIARRAPQEEQDQRVTPKLDNLLPHIASARKNNKDKLPENGIESTYMHICYHLAKKEVGLCLYHSQLEIELNCEPNKPKEFFMPENMTEFEHTV